MAAAVSAISPLSPGSKLDGWETPAPSATNSPVPTKCCDLPDYDPNVNKRNHQRTKDSQWNTASYPKQASPLPVPERPKPIRLATPNTGYPFPYVLSAPSTPLEAPGTRRESSASSSSSGGSSSSQPGSSSFSDDSSSSTPSSACSTPRDEPPQYASRSVTPSDVQHRRTKNAASTPGAPPPLGFAGSGHAASFVDYQDVKVAGGGRSNGTEEEDEEATPKKLANPLLAKLQNLSTD